ncbi:MAG: HAD-IA family hydrolase [Dermatophilaceae bacterium]
MPAVLFGSISTLADTSELQRDAFNRAFAEHGLDWSWDAEDYRSRLSTAGGRDRVAAYAQERGEQVDADAVHATKSRLFQESLAAAGVDPRPGVPETLDAARSAGHRVGLVTTTAPANVAALLQSLAPTVTAEHFDVVVDATDVDRPKPDGAAYAVALHRLGVPAEESVAVEDNVDGVAAARAAGVAVIAFPNENTTGHDFGAAVAVVDRIGLDDLDAHLPAPA